MKGGRRREENHFGKGREVPRWVRALVERHKDAKRSTRKGREGRRGERSWQG